MLHAILQNWYPKYGLLTFPTIFLGLSLIGMRRCSYRLKDVKNCEKQCTILLSSHLSCFVLVSRRTSHLRTLRTLSMNLKQAESHHLGLGAYTIILNYYIFLVDQSESDQSRIFWNIVSALIA